MSEIFYPKREDEKLCISCYYARMRTDICGIYCTQGFVEDGKCERFREYQHGSPERGTQGSRKRRGGK